MYEPSLGISRKHSDELSNQRQERGILRLGFVSAASMAIIPRVVRFYRNHLPGVELQMRNLPTAQQAKALLTGDIDIGFLRLPFNATAISVSPLSE